MTIHIPQFQDDVDTWNNKQPWRDDPPIVVVVGLGEEVGEVQRAVLKMHQGIRGTEAEWREEASKELGDVFIKCCALANAMGLDLQDCIERRWVAVSQRNFTKDRIGHGIGSD